MAYPLPSPFLIIFLFLVSHECPIKLIKKFKTLIWGDLCNNFAKSGSCPRGNSSPTLQALIYHIDKTCLYGYDPCMGFWSLYLDVWYWIYLLSVPIIIFSVKRNVPSWLKSGRLLFLIVLLPLMTSPLNYARTQAIEDFQSQDYGCWVYNFYFFLLFAGISIIYTGLWEYGWRRFYKQIFWDIKSNIQYGMTSNIVIFTSVTLALYFIIMLTVCPYCGDVYFIVKKFIYFNIIPLVC